MEFITFLVRCIFMFLATWLGIRIIGKKTISNMTAYDLAATMLISNLATEPLVYKISSKAAVGIIFLAFMAFLYSSLSLKEGFYNIRSNPIVLVSNGKILKIN